jgi:hypothetical protein
MFWVLGYFLLSSTPSVTPINTPFLFTPRVPYKTKFLDEENVVLETRLLISSTHVSWFVLPFNLLLAPISLLLFDVVPSILFIYPSYIAIMSRQILFHDIPNTTPHRAPWRRCEADTTSKVIFFGNYYHFEPFVFYFLKKNFCFLILKFC